ncbi:MAG: GNAT family N-acetyltransferase [Polaribacter sp.]|uniref:GNAT family N-acetyltransferase n=1 Tax=Polaribacter sp. TaxID=1920175 RepID=UPI002F35E4A0
MQEFSFSTFPELSTERLTLRQLTFDDVKPIFRLRSNKEINELITRETPKNLNEAEAFIDTCLNEFVNENRIFWGLELNSTKQLIGSIALHRIDLENNFAEVGYEVNPDYQDEGYMSEAMSKVLDFGITSMNLQKLEAFTHQNNTASIALLEKYLFVLQPERKDENIEDNRIYKFGS